MNCLEIQELLSPYLDDVVTPEESSDVEEHLRVCASCRQVLGDLQETVALIRSVPDIPLPESFPGQLHGILVRARRERRSGLLHRFPGWVSFSVAAVVFLIFFTAFGGALFQGTKPGSSDNPSSIRSQMAVPKAETDGADAGKEARQGEAEKKGIQEEENPPVSAENKFEPLVVFLLTGAVLAFVLTTMRARRRK